MYGAAPEIEAVPQGAAPVPQGAAGQTTGKNRCGTKWSTNYIILLYQKYRTEPRPPGPPPRAPKAPF